MQKRLSPSLLPAVCPVSHFCTFSELSLAKDTLLVQHFQMEPVPNMVNNPTHLHAIQEKAFIEVILELCYWKTATFSHSLIDVVLECTIEIHIF